MKTWAFITLFALYYSGAVNAGNTLSVYGDAQGIQNGELLYTEEHRINTATHKVTYRQADGSLIADKNIQYTQGYATPSFQLYDHRFGRTSGSKWQDGEWLLWQQQKSGERDEKSIQPHTNLVIDAGFNHFVLEHFALLEQGKLLDFGFAITDPPMEIPMTIQKKNCSNAIFSKAGSTVLCLKVVSHNILYRFFVPVIYLAYIHNPAATAGNAMHLNYVLRVPYKGKKLDLSVDDWMYQVDENTVINASTLSKWGFRVGSIQLAIVKH